MLDPPYSIGMLFRPSFLAMYLSNLSGLPVQLKIHTGVHVYDNGIICAKITMKNENLIYIYNFKLKILVHTSISVIICHCLIILLIMLIRQIDVPFWTFAL